MRMLSSLRAAALCPSWAAAYWLAWGILVAAGVGVLFLTCGVYHVHVF